MEHDQMGLLPEVLQSSFCGRFPGRWQDNSTDAGIVWKIIHQQLKDRKSRKKLEAED